MYVCIRYKYYDITMSSKVNLYFKKYSAHVQGFYYGNYYLNQLGQQKYFFEHFKINIYWCYDIVLLWDELDHTMGEYLVYVPKEKVFIKFRAEVFYSPYSKLCSYNIYI